MRKIVAVAVLSTVAAGCVAGDGGFQVAGGLGSAAGASLPQTCELHLNVGVAETECYYTRRIEPARFSEGFTVAPATRDYPGTIDCEGFEPITFLVPYGSEVRPGGTFQVKQVQLVSTQDGT